MWIRECKVGAYTIVCPRNPLGSYYKAEIVEVRSNGVLVYIPYFDIEQLVDPYWLLSSDECETVKVNLL